MSNPALEVQNISYKYGTYQALQDTSFTVKKGEIVLVSGPNGAGKTTLMLCLSGLMLPRSGKVIVDGYDLYQRERSAKRRLSFLPDFPHFYQELTTWEHIRFIALAHSVEQGFEERADSLLGEFDLLEARDLYPHALSRGMRLKLGIILCLIRPFSVLLMDEPTSALDPEGTVVLCETLSDLSADGAAILITTHDLSLASVLGGRMVRMQRGHIDLG
ncbi:MAG: ABC transporter ATP-binding protein [Anaerolineales bacterium]|nr:ABC transporter ATP-binding protein [Anaerolineales bacterium]